MHDALLDAWSEVLLDAWGDVLLVLWWLLRQD